MPLVHESRGYDTYSVKFQRSDGTSFETTFDGGRAQRQTGYRSGRLSDEVRATLDGSRSNTWAASLRVIQGLDYEYNTRVGRQASVVNPRDYEDDERNMQMNRWSTSAHNPVTGSLYYDSGTQGIALDCTVPTAGSLWVSETTAAQIGARLMRSSVPTAPAVDLIRSLGELRDFPSAFRNPRGLYLPRSQKEHGSAYLNFVFGIKPTVSDFFKLVDVVSRSTAVMQKYVDHQNHALRRSRTEEYARLAFTREYIHTGRGITTSILRDDSGGARTWGTVSSYAAASGRRSDGVRGSAFRVLTETKAVTTVKSFATFEYFIPRPTGFVGRLDLYRRKAEQILGAGFTPGVAYDLTRMSWLLDWFVDIGGLLHYQQTVSDNSVVASRSGWVSETTVHSKATLDPRRDVGFDTVTGGTWISVSGKYQRRRAGGPYQILQPWSLSENQAAIVSALGISRYSPA
jgi:hypothetical protein